MDRRFPALRALVVAGALAAISSCAAPDEGESTTQAVASQSRIWVQYQPGAKAVARGLLGSATIHHEFDSLEAFAVTVPSGAVAALRNNPNIALVEEDVVRYPLAAVSGELPPYGINLVQASAMHAAGETGAGATVCVIDSGLEIHPGSPEPGGSVTYVDSPGLPAAVDGSGHGTHVANTVAGAAQANGFVGVAPNANLVIVRVFGDDGTWAYSSSLANAAFACRDNGAQIISMSLGGGARSRTEERAFNELYANGAGILSIAAAGNDGNNRTSYPAGYASVVSVAAVDANSVKADFSQTNKDVELAAPGVAVWSMVPWLADASASSGGDTYSGAHMEGAATGSASGALADGGICDSVGSWSGQVVHCRRGTVTFAEKAQNAEAGGAVAVIISNNVAGDFSGTLGTYVSSGPVISVSQAAGDSLLANHLGQATTVTSTLDDTENGYEPWGGTSMATPHVSGVAALLKGACGSSASAIRATLRSTAVDLGASGKDNGYGYGLVQACSAAASLCGACP